MALMAASLPILPGQRERWNRFIAELQGPRYPDFAASRRRIGARERAYLQETPHGDTIIVTLEADDPAAAFARFGEAQDAFTDWFVAQVQAIHGLDLRHMPPGAAPVQVIDSHQRQAVTA